MKPVEQTTMADRPPAYPVPQCDAALTACNLEGRMGTTVTDAGDRARLGTFGMIAASLTAAFLLRWHGLDGSPDLRNGIEVTGALFGIVVASMFAAQYLASGCRRDLFIGLAFLVGGGQGLVCGSLDLGRDPAWTGLAADRAFAPLAVARFPGALVMAALLLAALRVSGPVAQKDRRRRELLRATVWTAVAVAAGLVVALRLPFSASGFAGRVVAYLAGLMPVFALVVSAGAYLRVFRRTCEPLAGWLALSIFIHAVGAAAMVLSRGPRDPLLGGAHLLGALGYAVAMLGFALCLIRSTAARTASEQAARESEQRLRTMVNTSRDAIIAVCPTGTIRFFNRAAENMFGLSEAEALGRPIVDLVPERFRQEYTEEVLRFFRDAAAGSTVEAIAQRHGGTEFPVELSLARGQWGAEPYVLAVLRDIGERARAAAALEESLSLLRATLESTADGVLVVDRKGRVTTMNRRFREMWRIPDDVAETGSNEKLLGYVLSDLQDPDRFLEGVKALYESPETESFDLIELRDGRVFERYSRPQRVGEAIVGRVWSFRDVTDRRRADKALYEAKVAAEVANQAKSEFLANMSHEIRTPMTAILGFAENLLDPTLSEDERLNAVQTIRRNGDHLLDIINDILDLSKVEAGRLSVERVACSPFQVVAQVHSLMQVRAGAKGLVFNIEYLGSIPATIRTDPVRLRQILLNLVGNAIKFTDTGGVRLVTRFLPTLNEAGEAAPASAWQPSSGGYIQFDVIDTGIGMSPAQIANVFRPFAQADSSITRRFGGTGLGLVISKRLAEMLGGWIRCESTPGEGSTFRVTISTGPLDGVPMLDGPPQEAPVAAAGSSPAALPPRLDCRILLAEDGPDNQRLISFVLKKAGAQVSVVENGLLGVEAALAARDQGRPFDVILMDMQMPVLDGYAATRMLRGKGYRGPILALTAHAMASDRQKCLDAGCDDYIGKPIDRRSLVETIARYAAEPMPA